MVVSRTLTDQPKGLETHRLARSCPLNWIESNRQVPAKARYSLLTRIVRIDRSILDAHEPGAASVRYSGFAVNSVGPGASIALTHEVSWSPSSR